MRTHMLHLDFVINDELVAGKAANTPAGLWRFKNRDLDVLRGDSARFTDASEQRPDKRTLGFGGTPFEHRASGLPSCCNCALRTRFAAARSSPA
jgi:hypothetical protein